MSRILLGVTGGIAAYKSCLLLRRLREAGHEVRVVPTESALRFVGAATWAALSGQPVATDVWTDAESVPHVRLGREADLVIVAPATADLLSRAAIGRADDLLANVLLTVTCPVVLVPAMHTEMWRNAATCANVATLRERGVVVMEPATGRLTGADSGPGRMPEPEDIERVALSVLAVPAIGRALADRDMAGLRVAVSAGGTHEAIDPVRYVGNASSGLMGLALARAAAQRGADVTLVGANLSLPVPAAVSCVPVTSTAELADAMMTASTDADLVVMAAAPADFTPVAPAASKIKKDGAAGLVVEFVQTTDVLAQLAARRPAGQVIVGFAAETAGDETELLTLGQAKLARKGCQLLVLNDVSGGGVFGAPDDRVVIIGADGVRARVDASKDVVAHAVWDAALGERKSA